MKWAWHLVPQMASEVDARLLSIELATHKCSSIRQVSHGGSVKITSGSAKTEVQHGAWW